MPDLAYHVHQMKSVRGQLREAEARLKRVWDALLADEPDDAKIAAALGMQEWRVRFVRTTREAMNQPALLMAWATDEEHREVYRA
jgi:hypothetical protein